MSYSYYDKRSAKVAIMSVLVDQGWKVYGYKADESDMMTDYWSPADWDGVAEKNGFVLLIDQYSTHYSGYEVKKYNYNVKGTSSDNYKKIEKLTATMNDPAASENEKEVCKRKIEALTNKEPNQPTYEVLETYPVFSFANPKSCTWHIEKDGEIIAKGKGLTSVYECNSRENTKANAEKFVAKIEKHIADNTQLEKVIVKTVKKVIKPIQVTDRQTIQKDDVLSFDYHGHFWKVIDVYIRNDGKVCATYELLGSEKRGYSTLKNATRYYDYMVKLEKNIQEGKVKIHTLQEVEEVTEKVTYKKTTRKQKVQQENLLSSEEVQEEQLEQAAQPQTEINEQQEVMTTRNANAVTYEVNTGSKGNGIEITFSEKPSEETRSIMKANGFRWGGKNRSSIWWAILTGETLTLAKQLAGNQAQTADNSDLTEKQDNLKEHQETVFTYPDIDIDDIEAYTIDQTLQEREHDSNWIMRTKKADRKKEIQEYFAELTNEVKDIINTTSNEYLIYQLKKTLQYYKKNYFTNYVARLRNKADNPSWVVTGAAGRNRSRDQKYNNRYDKLMQEWIDLDNDYKKRISSLKSKIRKDKENILKEAVNNTDISISFATETKEFEFMGLKEKKRVYIAGNYFITKTWGCFRIFNSSTNKEVHSMKTTEKLDDAKRHVVYLMLQDQTKKAV